LNKIILLSSVLTTALLAEVSEAEIAKAQADLSAAKAQVEASQSILDTAKKEKEAKNPTPPPASEFTTHTELGYVSTSGNTDTKTGAIDFNGKQSWNVHSIVLDVDYLYGEQDGVENNNKLITELNYYYDMTDRFALNYLVGYKDDKFSGFDYQFYTGPGAKYKAIISDAHKLNFQGNILYSQDEGSDKFFLAGEETPYPFDPVKGPDKVDGKTDNYSSYLAKMDYTWQMTENFKFYQDLSYRADFEDSDNYFVYSKTGIESKISDMFSLGIHYKIDYINLAPEGNERTDKTFTAALIIDY